MRRFAPLVLVSLVPLLAAAKPPAKDAPATAAKPAKPAATSVWEPLVAPGARFVLVPGGTSTSRIVVEAYDARVVGGAKVARLRWVVEDGGTRSPMGNSLPTQIAGS